MCDTQDIQIRDHHPSFGALIRWRTARQTAAQTTADPRRISKDNLNRPWPRDNLYEVNLTIFN
jgi:hypothetical protein